MGDCSIKQEQNDIKIYLQFLRREVRAGRLRVIREDRKKTEYGSRDCLSLVAFLLG